MTKLQQRRREQFLPNGIPKYVRIYDNDFDGNGTADNFTVVFTGRGHTYEGERRRWHPVIGMGPSPYHPQGVYLHNEYDHVIDAPQGWPVAIGRKCHLGKRISFESLPADCQKLVMEDYMEYHNLK